MTPCDSPEMGIRSQSSAKAGLLGRSPPLTSREIEFDVSKNRCSFISPQIKVLRHDSPVQNNKAEPPAAAEITEQAN